MTLIGVELETLVFEPDAQNTRPPPQTQHKVELHHKFCRSTTITISKTQRLPALASDVITLIRHYTTVHK